MKYLLLVILVATHKLVFAIPLPQSGSGGGGGGGAAGGASGGAG